MKNIPSFEQFINEMKWDPNGKWMNSVLIDNNELKDESTISQFIEFTGLPKLVLDIWKYAKSNLNRYPSKMTDRGMVYSAPNSCKVELEFTKDGKVNLWKFRVEMNREMKIDSSLMRATSFNFKEFKQMLES
jgi:hypothetical protein